MPFYDHELDRIRDRSLTCFLKALAIAAGAIVEALNEKDPPLEPTMTDKAIVDEPESLPEVAEEPTTGGSPPSPKSSEKERRHRHRSSRHSTSSRSHHSSSKESPFEDSFSHR